jgi:excinuclease ABC subunit C
MKVKLKEKLDSLSSQAGIYLFKNENGKILYVGKAKNLKNRVRSYFQDPKNLPLKTNLLMTRVADFDTIIVDNEVEALILESNFIKKHKPKYNINLKDDKSYPYIRITNEPFPKIFVTRKIVKDGSRYLGPYTEVKHLRQIIKTVRKIFPIRSCHFFLDKNIIASRKVKLCLDYHIKRCLGPCEGLIDQTEYGQIVRQVEKFLQGKTRELCAELRVKMESESQKLHYENAAHIRDQIKKIESYYLDRHKLLLNDFDDKDVVALAAEDNDACVVVFKIRDGKVISRQHFYLEGVEEKITQEVLVSFLQQYYLESNDIPKQILLPIDAGEQKELLSIWLSNKVNHNV